MCFLFAIVRDNCLDRIRYWTSYLYKDPIEFVYEAVYALISIVQRPRQQILHRFLQRVFEIVAQ